MFEAFVAAFSASFWKVFGPFSSFVGAMLAYLGSMLGPSSPILSYVVFMSSPSFPNFA